MKKVKPIVLVFTSIVVIISALFLTLNRLDSYYSSKIEGAYYDFLGGKLLVEKNQGIELQRRSLERSDNVALLGSSELTTIDVPSHPVNMFNDKSRGFQINMLGRGHCQDLIHTLSIGASSEYYKNKKVVFILSPQWFTKQGVSEEEFLMNFSELHFYEFMKNPSISKDIKLKLTKRVSGITAKNNYNIYVYSKLYSKDSTIFSLALKAASPYYDFKHYLLKIKDKKKAYEILKSNSRDKITKAKVKDINWEEELNKQEQLGKTQVTNNEFNIINSYYDKYIKTKLDEFKGYSKGQSYSTSPEYDDLRLLLELCKDRGIEPLFVSVPVHGKWYDYCEFKKEDREVYYKNVREMVRNSGFQLLDLSNKEYEPYFFVDIMHLGWKGWIYIDKAIDQYYNQN